MAYPSTTSIFHLFIKECAFRFNYGTPSQQLKTLKHWLRKEGYSRLI